jgi:cytochrome c
MRFFAAVLAFIFSTSLSWAQEFGGKDEAVALVKKGIEHIKSAGPEKAFAEFSDPKGKFVDRDLYLIVTDMTGTRVAHGQNAKLIGKNIAESTDVAGKPYGKEIVDGAKAAGSGWVDYVFSDPVTKKVLPKSSYYEKAGDYIVYCGIYKR